MESSQYTRGTQLFGLGRYQEAIKAFKSELSMNPDDDYSKYYLTLCYINLDDFNHAEDLVKSSLSSNPNFSETHYLNSIIQLQKDKHKVCPFLWWQLSQIMPIYYMGSTILYGLLYVYGVGRNWKVRIANLT